MKVLIICSTSFYDRIEDVRKVLVGNGHEVFMPNCYDEPVTNEDKLEMDDSVYMDFFKRMYFESRDAISNIDSVLVLNYTKIKNGKAFENYIGASTFLEMYEAFMQNKKIFVMNDLPDNMLFEELKGFNPVIINGDLELVR